MAWLMFLLIDWLTVQHLIVDKAMEDLKREEQEKAQEKKRILEERVPPLDLDNLSQGDITCFVYRSTCMICNNHVFSYMIVTAVLR